MAGVGESIERTGAAGRQITPWVVLTTGAVVSMVGTAVGLGTAFSIDIKDGVIDNPDLYSMWGPALLGLEALVGIIGFAMIWNRSANLSKVTNEELQRHGLPPNT
jgi:hypothetical protein